MEAEQVNFYPFHFATDFLSTSSSSSSSSSSYQQQCPSKRRRRSNLGNQQTRRVIKKPTFSKKPDPLAPKITSPCTECGKKFWSWKALFGHMRSHPERNWRGINPPPSSSSKFSPKQPDPEELSELSSTITGESFTKMTEEEYGVADCLLLLANSPVLINGSDKTGGGGVLVGGHDQWQCNICFGVFSSGQDLGCHKICHNSSSASSSSGFFVALSEKDQVFGFDFNSSCPKNSAIMDLDLRLGL